MVVVGWDVECGPSAEAPCACGRGERAKRRARDRNRSADKVSFQARDTNNAQKKKQETDARPREIKRLAVGCVKMRVIGRVSVTDHGGELGVVLMCLSRYAS